MQKHHWSYNIEHAKDVIFLGSANHSYLHRFLIYDQERFMFRCVVSAGDYIKGELLDTKERHIEYSNSLPIPF